MTENNSLKILEYRNGVYQGQVSKDKRQGKGILITDQGNVFVSTWRNDLLNDKTLIWTGERSYVIGEFNRGIMEGDFVFRTQHTTFYVSFVFGKVDGRQVLVDRRSQTAKVFEYKNMEYRVVAEVDTRGFGEDESKILRQSLGYDVTLMDAGSFIDTFMIGGSDKTFEQQVTGVGQKLVWFNKGNSLQKVGFSYLKDQLTSYGVFVDGKLDGIGCKYENKVKYDGLFRNGALNGFGMVYKIPQKKYIAGHFENGNLKKEVHIDQHNQQGVPDISRLKKMIHMQSLFFVNAFVKESSLLRYKGYEETVTVKSGKGYDVLKSTPEKNTLNHDYARFPNNNNSYADSKSISEYSSRNYQPLTSSPIQTVEITGSSKRGSPQNYGLTSQSNRSKPLLTTQESYSPNRRKRAEDQLSSAHEILDRLEKIPSNSNIYSPSQKRPYNLDDDNNKGSKYGNGNKYSNRLEDDEQSMYTSKGGFKTYNSIQSPSKKRY